MSTDERPLSTLVAQGWEIVGFSTSHDASGYAYGNVLLRRQKQHKILSVRGKTFGGGIVDKEMDL